MNKYHKTFTKDFIKTFFYSESELEEIERVKKEKAKAWTEPFEDPAY